MFSKVVTTLLIVVSFFSSAFAQNEIELSDTLIAVGVVHTNASKQTEVKVLNNSLETRMIRRAYMSESVFNVDIPNKTILPGNETTVFIAAAPEQNINYTDFLIVEIEDYPEMLICEIRLSGRFGNTYYNGTENKWGSDLKSALHNIIDGHISYPYTSGSTDVWDILKNTDEDPDNSANIIQFYTGWSHDKSDQNTGGTTGWNREHVWAKFHGDFGNDPPAGTDVHHLRPSDATVNSKRGNLDFDNGGTIYVDGDGATECRFDSDSWEPRDNEKGDVARMMYYMVVRYEGEEGYDLELVENTPSTLSGEPIFGKLSTLNQWHKADPVSDWEESRNEKIYTNWQQNRNPFIDYPQLTDRLPSLSGIELTYQNPKFTIPTDTLYLPAVNVNQTSSYTIRLINSGGSVLNISDISIADARLQPSIQTTSISEESYVNLEILFLGDASLGVVESELTINSNDPEKPQVKIPVSVMVKNTTGLESTPIINPHFTLNQNYPNPFNPETAISYQLSKHSKVHLAVYDLLGKKVATLVNKIQNTGFHTISFNASQIPGGVYFYSLVTNEGTSTRKMLLLP